MPQLIPDPAKDLKKFREYLKRLTNEDKFDLVSDKLSVELAKQAPSYDLINWLQQASGYLRLVNTAANPSWDFRHNLYLPGKSGRPVELIPFPAQQLIIDRYESAIAANKPLRLLIPKSRQHGVSQIIAAIIYRHLARSNGAIYNALVMAHEEPAAKVIFGKYSFYHENDPIAPKQRVGNRNELIFRKGDRINVRTAGGKAGAVGRGDTIHAVHFSESSSYPDDAEIYNAVAAAVPPIDEAWTMWFDESTGRGQRGTFYHRCQLARFDQESTDWELLFLPWTIRYDAVENFRSDEEKEKFIKGMTDEEVALTMPPHNCTPEQLKWARSRLREAEGADAADKKRFFRQEHPISIDEAFQASGGSAFDVDKIQVLILKCEERDYKKPPDVGDITAEGPLLESRSVGDGKTYAVVTPNCQFRAKGAKQRFTRWKTPARGHKYVMGVDIATGRVKGDFSVISVFDRTAREFVARFRAKESQEGMVAPVRLISKYYNDATIVIEANTFGAPVIDWLAETDRREYLFISKNPQGTDVLDKTTMRYGFLTTQRSKYRLIALHKSRMDVEPQIYTDKMILQEMLHFEETVNKSGEVVIKGAGIREHDDVFMASSFALVGDEDGAHVSADREKIIEAPRDMTPAERYAAHVAHYARKSESFDPEDYVF